MIRKAEVCHCHLCGNAWLPVATEHNPDADPRKVERCGRCKSKRWNDDDPKAVALKQKPKPITEKQRQIAKANMERARKTTRSRQAFARESRVETTKPADTSAPIEFCQHRLMKIMCPRCRETAR